MMSYLIFSRIITGLFLTFVDPSGVHLLSKPWSRPNHRDDSHKEKKKSLIMLHTKSKGDPHVNLKREMFIVSASIGIFPTSLEDHLINLLWLLSTI